MDSVSYNVTNTTMTVVVSGEVYTFPKERCSKRLKELLNTDNIQSSEELIFQLVTELDKATAIQEYTEGKVKVKNGLVYFKDEPLDNPAADEVISFMEQGLPHKPILNFLDLLLDNTSRRAVEQSYPFIKQYNMQISPEGFLIAYKGVRTNYFDKYSNTVRNKPGDRPPKKERNEVDDNPNNGCSYGYHVGSYRYAKDWGEIVMRVKVNPKDIVSVPTKEWEKMRVTEYEVIDEVDQEYMDKYGAPRVSENMSYNSSDDDEDMDYENIF